jgi:hypothetical protein
MRAHGVHRNAVARRIADGRLVELWPDTFLIGVDPELAPRDVIRAAALACVGPGSSLDGLSALHRRGMWERHDESIQVVGPRGHAAIPDYGITFRRSGARAATSDLVDGIATRDASEALIAGAAALSAHQIAYILGRGEYLGQLSTASVLDELQRCAGRTGTPAVRRALELRVDGSAGTRGCSEDRLLPNVTAAHGEPLVNVRGAAGIPDYEPDFCWQGRRWIVEIDGGHHLDPDVRAIDQARDRLLTSAGWIVVRIWWKDVWMRLHEVLAHIARCFSGCTVPSIGADCYLLG